MARRPRKTFGDKGKQESIRRGQSTCVRAYEKAKKKMKRTEKKRTEKGGAEEKEEIPLINDEPPARNRKDLAQFETYRRESKKGNSVNGKIGTKKLIGQERKILIPKKKSRRAKTEAPRRGKARRAEKKGPRKGGAYQSS